MADYIPDIRTSINWSENWLIVVFLIQLLILAWLSYNYPRKVRRPFLILFNREIEKQEFSERFSWTSTFSLAFMSVFFISVAWFVYIVMQSMGLAQFKGTDGVLFFLLLLLGLILLYLLKLLLLNITGELCTGDYAISLYSYSMGQYYQVTGLFLFPIAALMTFVPGIPLDLWLGIGVGIYALFYLLRLLRGVINSYEAEAQPFYLILYLCTFEFLPIVLAVNYFFSWFSVG